MRCSVRSTYWARVEGRFWSTTSLSSASLSALLRSWFVMIFLIIFRSLDDLWSGPVDWVDIVAWGSVFELPKKRYFAAIVFSRLHVIGGWIFGFGARWYWRRRSDVFWAANGSICFSNARVARACKIVRYTSSSRTQSLSPVPKKARTKKCE